MTEEEYFRKTYPDSCYGDRLLSPYWDFFQDGVEFGERQSEKKIEVLESQNKLLGERCNQLLKDKGELTDRVQELEQQTEMMQDAKCTSCTDLGGLQLKITELETENAELKEKYVKNVCDCEICDTYCNSLLIKLKDLLKKMFYLYFGPCVTHKDLENRDKLFEEVKQLIKEIEN